MSSTPNNTNDITGWTPPFPVHPAAALMPMMPDEQLDELGQDITANGLREPVGFWQDPATSEWKLLDGRNRIAALDREGHKLDAKKVTEALSDGKPYAMEQDDKILFEVTVVTGDPTAYVMSANVRRRHLSRSQKQKAITALLELEPTRSDRQIAKDVGVDHKTVGVVRAKAEQEGTVETTMARVGADGRKRTIRVVPDPPQASTDDKPEPEPAAASTPEPAPEATIACPHCKGTGRLAAAEGTA